jgi:hypothetical protein
MREELSAVYASFCRHLTTGDPASLAAVYRHLANVGGVIDSVRLRPAREEDIEFIPALATVLHTDERLLMQSLEQVRIVANTRTPLLLRGFTVGGAVAFPIVFAPYFGKIIVDPDDIPAWAGYLVSFIYSVTLTALVSVEEALENPFDGDGNDDISLDQFAPEVSTK